VAEEVTEVQKVVLSCCHPRDKRVCLTTPVLKERKKAIASCTIALHPISGKNTKMSLKNGVHIKIHS